MLKSLHKQQIVNYFLIQEDVGCVLLLGCSTGLVSLFCYLFSECMLETFLKCWFKPGVVLVFFKCNFEKSETLWENCSLQGQWSIRSLILVHCQQQMQQIRLYCSSGGTTISWNNSFSHDYSQDLALWKCYSDAVSLSFRNNMTKSMDLSSHCLLK